MSKVSEIQLNELTQALSGSHHRIITSIECNNYAKHSSEWVEGATLPSLSLPLYPFGWLRPLQFLPTPKCFTSQKASYKRKEREILSVLHCWFGDNGDSSLAHTGGSYVGLHPFCFSWPLWHGGDWIRWSKDPRSFSAFLFLSFSPSLLWVV